MTNLCDCCRCASRLEGLLLLLASFGDNLRVCVTPMLSALGKHQRGCPSCAQTLEAIELIDLIIFSEGQVILLLRMLMEAHSVQGGWLNE